MTTDYRTSRRGFLRAAALTAGAGLFGTGCAGPRGAGRPVDIAYWNFFTGGDGERMVGLIDAYRAQAPGVRVTDTTLLWGSPYYTKLAMAAAGGLAPDVASMHASRLATFAAELLDPWDPAELAARGVHIEEFPQPVRDRVVIDGRLMALPLDTHPLVLFYNADVCGRAGLLAPDGGLAPIANAAAFLDAGRRAAQVTRGTGVAWAATDDLAAFMLFWTLFRQAGGVLKLPDGGPVEVDRDTMVTVLGYLRDLCDGTVCSATLGGPDAPALFAAGQTGFLLIGPWEVTTAQTAGLRFGMTQFPALYGDTPLARADSHSFVFPRQNRGLDPARRAASYDLAVSMVRNSLDWARGGHIPALSAVADSPQYLALHPQSDYRDAARVAEFDPAAYFSGSGSTLMSRATQSIQGVTSRSLTPEAATDELIAWLGQQVALGSPTDAAARAAAR